jgi:hypothetical protein
MFEASETGRLLMKAMEAIAATLSPAEPSPESREGIIAGMREDLQHTLRLPPGRLQIRRTKTGALYHRQ